MSVWACMHVYVHATVWERHRKIQGKSPDRPHVEASTPGGSHLCECCVLVFKWNSIPMARVRMVLGVWMSRKQPLGELKPRGGKRTDHG